MNNSHNTIGVVDAIGELPVFLPGATVRIDERAPVGHYRVPNYLRGKLATVEKVIKRKAVNNEEEGFGRNAGSLRHYYRLAIPMNTIWSTYEGAPTDSLRIEVFETWLKGEAT
ncbi:SH3-like domain-containing protein [Pararhizobium sp. DWP3-4]|uniref:SH3-like domain-containing protein n=1 Tax=unclassified Pararhizobium TaxID=2643050 RepID=UPI003CECFFCD